MSCEVRRRWGDEAIKLIMWTMTPRCRAHNLVQSHRQQDHLMVSAYTAWWSSKDRRFVSLIFFNTCRRVFRQKLGVQRNTRQINLRNSSNIINMITQRDKKIKKQLTTTSLHLHLHSPATLECSSRSNDQSQIMSSKLRIVVGCIGICVSCWWEDCWALNSGFCCND